MQILKGTGDGWSEKKLIRKLYIYQCIKLRLAKGETKKIEDKLDMAAFCRRFNLTVTANTTPRKVLNVLETSK
jgi:hypothetical protein